MASISVVTDEVDYQFMDVPEDIAQAAITILKGIEESTDVYSQENKLL